MRRTHHECNPQPSRVPATSRHARRLVHLRSRRRQGGNLANVEGTPEKLAVETTRGRLARADFGSRGITGTPEGKPVKLHPQCQRMCDLLDGSRGKLDRPTLQGFFGDHQSGVCKHPDHKGGFTVDSMLFDCTRREAHVSRGPGCSGRWKTFSFEDA